MSSNFKLLDTELRLILLSSSVENIQFLSKSVRKNVKKVIYTYDSSTLDDILSFIIAELGGQKVQSIGLVLSGNSKEMHLAGVGNIILSHQTLQHETAIKEFFLCLSSTFMNSNKNLARIDIMNSSFSNKENIIRLTDELHKIVQCPVGIWEDIYQCDVKVPLQHKGELKHLPISELYFIPEKLEEFLNSSLQSQMQNLSGYEKIRTVGKGAFGTAVLYRKKYDDSFVIVKEINMHDLTASERQLAINEICVKK